jgi:hypothetical protein
MWLKGRRDPAEQTPQSAGKKKRKERGTSLLGKHKSQTTISLLGCGGGFLVGAGSSMLGKQHTVSPQRRATTSDLVGPRDALRRKLENIRKISIIGSVTPASHTNNAVHN